MLCGPPSPVFYLPLGIEVPLLDRLVGRPLARKVLSLYVTPLEGSPYGEIGSCDAGYLGAALSSLWALLVVVIAFVAGATAPTKRKLAGKMLAAGGLISLTDTTLRIFAHLDGLPSDRQSLLISNIPAQLVANFAFQFLIPFAIGLGIGLLAEGCRWLFLHFTNFHRSRQ